MLCMKKFFKFFSLGSLKGDFLKFLFLKIVFEGDYSTKSLRQGQKRVFEGQKSRVKKGLCRFPLRPKLSKLTILAIGKI